MDSICLSLCSACSKLCLGKLIGTRICDRALPFWIAKMSPLSVNCCGRTHISEESSVMNVDFVAIDRPRLIFRRARLFARVHRPYQLIEGESYWVDLGVPRFDILWAGKPVSVARAQLIATYVPESSEWLWGFENSTTPRVATEELKVAIGRVPQLAEQLAGRKWNMDADTACDLADWIAFRTGYEAMYPAIAGNMNTTVFLALTFIEHDGKPAEGLASWCLSCGEMAGRLSGRVIGGPEGRLLCSACAKDPIEALEFHEAEKPDFLAGDPGDEPSGAPLANVVCAFCGRRRPRVFLPETALCWWCIDRIRKLLASAEQAK